MKKRLYLLRHAKSSWKDFSLNDFDRPLNKRGKYDAPFMAKKFAAQKVPLDLIISSPAKRARKTAKIFAETLHIELHLEKKLYDAEIEEMLKIIHQAFQNNDAIMLVGHNPELNLLNDMLSDKEIYNIPTAGLVAIEFEGDTLKKGKNIFYLYPKLYKGIS